MCPAPARHLPVEPLAIALAERARFASVFRHNTVPFEPFAGGVMGRGAPDTWQSMAHGAGLENPVEEHEVDRFCEFYRSWGAEPRIELVPCAHPTLLAALSARGFVIRRFLDEYYRPLPGDEDLRGLLPHGWPRGPDGTALEIRRALRLTPAALVPVTAPGRWRRLPRRGGSRTSAPLPRRLAASPQRARRLDSRTVPFLLCRRMTTDSVQ